MPKLNPAMDGTDSTAESNSGRELEALYRLTDRLFRAGSAENIYAAALDAITDAIGCERASILLFDEQGTMQFVAWRGLSEDYRRAVDGHTPWRAGAREAEPILVGDIDAAEEPDALKAVIRAEGVRALAFVPLVAAGGVTGKFMIYYPQPHAFSDHEVDLAVTIGRQLGFALERLSAEENLRRERELFQTIVDRIPVMITVYEPGRALLRLNREFEQVLGWSTADGRQGVLMEALLPDVERREQVRAFMDACPEGWLDVEMRARDGRLVETSWANKRLSDQTQVGIGLDITARKAAQAALQRQAERLAALNRIARTLSSDLDLERIVQEASDSATALSGAQVGAFFQNVGDPKGERYMLYTLSGVRREGLESLDQPRDTALFEPDFGGERIVRSDDVRRDLRYEASARHLGSSGHLPVVSYLAAQVLSRSGGVHGVLLFGHELAGAFTQDDEVLVAGIAAHTALALDNTALLAAKQHEIDQRREAEWAAQRLAAIVENSQDAILGKDLNGIITSWNAGAERLLGYRAQEMIGKSAMMIVPPEREEEERRILLRMRAGDPVAPFETVRLCKNGERLPVTLAVSPVRDSDGRIIGASTIARDITERLNAEARQSLLIREMDHRIKNLFTLAASLVTLSARTAENSADLARAVTARLAALAESHALTLPGDFAGEGISLHDLIRTILSPYEYADPDPEQFTINGPDLALKGETVTAFALLLHEFATNAAKHGALSSASGRIAIDCVEVGDRFEMIWKETGGPPTLTANVVEGFGSRLAKATVGQLGGKFFREWTPEGLTVRISASRARLNAS